jgi:hypothetical protein
MRPDPRANARQEGLRHMRSLSMLQVSYYGHSSPTLVLKRMRAGCCCLFPAGGAIVHLFMCLMCPYTYVRSHITEAQYSIEGVMLRWH